MSLLGRTILLRYNNYQRIDLTPQEQEKLMNELLEHNHRELQRIMEFSKKNGLNEGITKILFDKQLITAFTAWTNALEEKVHEIKSRFNKPMSKEKEAEIKTAVERGLGLKPKDEVQNGHEQTIEGERTA